MLKSIFEGFDIETVIKKPGHKNYLARTATKEPPAQIGNLTLSAGFKLIEQASSSGDTLIVGNFVLFHNPFENMLSSVECSAPFLFVSAAKAQLKRVVALTLSAFCSASFANASEDAAFKRKTYITMHCTRCMGDRQMHSVALNWAFK